MPDPITFATEAERLAAREQYVAIHSAIYGEKISSGAHVLFDQIFPPIAPCPKMVPHESLVIVDEATGRYESGLYTGYTPEVEAGQRIARVRVVEVDDE